MLTQNKEKADKTKQENLVKIAAFIKKNDKGRGSFIKSLADGFQFTFVKAYTQKSRANAIKAKCIDCACFQRLEITNCTAYTCPLWEIRPYQQ